MNENHKALVVKIDEVRIHPNADSLSLVDIKGYQVVVRTEEFRVGHLYIYVPPDSVVPQLSPFAFLWSDKGLPDGVVPEKYRRVTVRRFRGEWSEGLLLPLKTFCNPGVCVDGFHWVNLAWAEEGNDVAEALGITHYEEPEPSEDYNGPAPRQEKGLPRSLKGWYYLILRVLFGIDKNGPTGGSTEKPPRICPPVYDVESFKNFNKALIPGEDVFVTEKVHGSNARFMFDGKRMWAGSKKLWRSDKSTCIWRRALKELPWIEEWCRYYQDYTLYAEIVPTQSEYKYGTNEQTPIKVLGFDVRTRGGWLPKEDAIIIVGANNFVPILYRGPYAESVVKPLAEGKSQVEGADHIREGIVISTAEERHVRGLGRVQLKLKSMKFLETEGKNTQEKK